LQKIRYISDLHFGVNRRSPFVPKYTGEESDQILILAGDVCDSSCSGINFLQDVCNNFKQVLYVFGNHEYYGCSITGAKQYLLDQFNEIPSNLHILDCETFETEDIVFIGATLWTDLDGYNPNTVNIVSRCLNDCRMIRATDDRKDGMFNGDVWYNLHVKHRDYIKLQTMRAKEIEKTPIVITHHAPSYQSVHEVFKGSDINGGFASDMDDLLERLEVPYWIHGHMHHVHDYILHNTRVLCNPHGYNMEDLQQRAGVLFNPLATIEI
jgi:UDP-2,3-diacylglucosamine pyrophosphatase LpxH